MVSSGDFRKNLRYLRAHKKLSQDALAGLIGLGRSTLSRLETGREEPTTTHLDLIAQYAGLRDPDALLVDHSTFRRIIQNEEARTNLMLLSFRSIKENLDRCEGITKEYAGQYVVYYCRTAEQPQKVVASLLTIERATNEGIECTFINPYKDKAGMWTAFEYAGLIFPVSEFLYGVCEQKQKTYEILSLIIRASSAPRVNALRGIITGIGVDEDDNAYIAARPMVALRRQRPIEDWRGALDKELGFLPQDRLPEMVRRQLSDEKITIR